MALKAAPWATELSIKDRTRAACRLRTDDGRTPNSSLLLAETNSRDEAMTLIEGDQATRAGLRGSITIRYISAVVMRGSRFRPKLDECERKGLSGALENGDPRSDAAASRPNLPGSRHFADDGRTSRQKSSLDDKIEVWTGKCNL